MIYALPFVCSHSCSCITNFSHLYFAIILIIKLFIAGFKGGVATPPPPPAHCINLPHCGRVRWGPQCSSCLGVWREGTSLSVPDPSPDCHIAPFSRAMEFKVKKENFLRSTSHRAACNADAPAHAYIYIYVPIRGEHVHWSLLTPLVG